MIEWEKSAKLHNLTVDELKVYFEKRPGSNIKILVMCKKCKKERYLTYYNYINNNCTDMCYVCSHKEKRKSKKITTVCNNCGKKIIRRPSHIKNHNFCCPKCAAMWRSKNLKIRQHISATLQGITYDEWENFAKDQPYCPLFNEECRESNREKYDRKCFICGLPEEENITSTGKQLKLSVHHYDMDKMQGCNGHEWKLVPLCVHHHGGNIHTKLWEIRIIYLLKNVW